MNKKDFPDDEELLVKLSVFSHEFGLTYENYLNSRISESQFIDIAGLAFDEFINYIYENFERKKNEH